MSNKLIEMLNTTCKMLTNISHLRKILFVDTKYDTK